MKLSLIPVVALSLVSSSFAVTVDGLRYVGQYTLPYGPTATNGTEYNNTLVGGLSGIDYDAATNSYYAISDDRSQSGAQPAARFYNLSINVNANGFVGANPVTINSVQTIKRPDGTTFPSSSVDPESIRVVGSGASRTLYWTSEGAAATSSNPPVQNPFARQMNLDGSYVRELATPTKFNPDAATGQTRGVRNNLAFESLTLNLSQTKAFVGTENALAQDGPATSFGIGSNSRVVRYDVATGAAEAEFVYPVAPVVDAPTPGQFATNGLVELLALSDTEFLSVERSFSTGAAGRGNTIRIFKTTLNNATDVSGFDTLLGQTFTPMRKQLLISFDAGGPVNPDNIEGITFGPTLSDGSPSILLVSDNNFSSTQATQFVMLAVPEPSGLAALACGGLILVWRRRVSAR